MLRIELKPIEIPSGVEIKVTESNLCTVKEPKGELVEQMPKEVIIKVEDNTITVSRPSEVKRHKSLHGLAKTLVFDMTKGATERYKKALIIEGTGYKAVRQGKKLVLNLGYSHTIEKEDPEETLVEVPKQHALIISGISKQRVGSYTAKIRDLKGSEPYKGKGIRHEDEHIRRKVGETGK